MAWGTSTTVQIETPLRFHGKETVKAQTHVGVPVVDAVPSYRGLHTEMIAEEERAKCRLHPVPNSHLSTMGLDFGVGGYTARCDRM